jgi:hypothetical protein
MLMLRLILESHLCRKISIPLFTLPPPPLPPHLHPHLHIPTTTINQLSLKMSSNMTQRLPPASNGTHSGNGRGHRGELCYPHKLVEYFVSSANTPVHIPDVPGCFKLLPIVTIFVSLLAMVYSAYIGLSAIWFFGCVWYRTPSK